MCEVFLRPSCVLRFCPDRSRNCTPKWAFMLHSDRGPYFAQHRIDRRHYPQSRQNTPKHFSMQSGSKPLIAGQLTNPDIFVQAVCSARVNQLFLHRSVQRISLQDGQGPGLPNAPPHLKVPARQQIAEIENTHHQQAVQVPKQPQPKVLNEAPATPTKQQPSALDLQTTESPDHQMPCLDQHDALHPWHGQRSQPHHPCVQQLFSYRHATMRKSVPLAMGLTCLLSRFISTKP